MPESVTITFPPSPSPQVVCATLRITDDQIALEGDECFNVDCENITAYIHDVICLPGMVIIEDNDGKFVYFGACSMYIAMHSALIFACASPYCSCDGEVC